MRTVNSILTVISRLNLTQRKDIFSDVRVLALGGDHEPWVEKPKMISCCTDGIRPVSFTLERLDY